MKISSILKYFLILILVFWMSFDNLFAQGQYQTSAGVLIVTIQLNNKPVNVKSNELLMQLDYETGNIVIKQEISALKSDDKTIQSKIDSLSEQQIIFKGKLGLDYINTSGHPPIDFQVEGTIQTNGKRVIGTGQLVHRVQGTTSACLLSLNFKINLGEVFPQYKFEGLNEEIYVQVLQSILGRVGD